MYLVIIENKLNKVNGHVMTMFVIWTHAIANKLIKKSARWHYLTVNEPSSVSCDNFLSNEIAQYNTSYVFCIFCATSSCFYLVSFSFKYFSTKLKSCFRITFLSVFAYSNLCKYSRIFNQLIYLNNAYCGMFSIEYSKLKNIISSFAGVLKRFLLHYGQWQKIVCSIC